MVLTGPYERGLPRMLWSARTTLCFVLTILEKLSLKWYIFFHGYIIRHLISNLEYFIAIINTIIQEEDQSQYPNPETKMFWVGLVIVTHLLFRRRVSILLCVILCDNYDIVWLSKIKHEFRLENISK